MSLNKHCNITMQTKPMPDLAVISHLLYNLPSSAIVINKICKLESYEYTKLVLRTIDRYSGANTKL